ncbi:hypothetical protein JR316_0008876 [Psilocybe cubensis]|uniref:Uncharacterized protein n=2 Tax=Psilocybe cubensis TaxID=181762 RepID=A0ACB8GT64_PSICU|nr:hypothetical protein JR316_0008876 [Psilocybe cubensis]KAH9478421.1 hypothetical protein JR316_0008876 [Psilocybe cubensis]
MPEGLQHMRYQNRPTTKKEIKCFEMPPCAVHTQDIYPSGWVKCTHPEGVRYFHHNEKHVYTDSNICDEHIYHDLMEDIDTILRHRVKWVVDLPYVDLVINTRYCDEDPTRTFSAYYFISHSYFSVFFMDHYKMDSLSVNNQVYGPTSWDHLGYEIEAQYWYHVQLYPHSRFLTRETIAQLRDVVLHFIGDTMTSPTSTAPYSMQDLRDILALTRDMERNLDLPAWVGTQSLLARQMFIFCRAKYLHFHGEPHARVERDVSVYGDIYKRTWLVKYLSPILFFAPDFHLKNLQSMWVDRIMHKSVFRDAMKKMNEEWDRYVLFATVMLSANVGFLAIQSVDNDTSPQRSAAQIASYVSMLASIGSIVLGLHLSRQNKTKDRENVDNITEVVSTTVITWSKFSGQLTSVAATVYGASFSVNIWRPRGSRYII